jgi:integrase/recombinase XerD
MGKARSRVSGVVLSGPLAPFGEAFRVELDARGYTPRSVVPQLRQMGRLSCWLQEQALSAAELDERRVEEFLAVQRDLGRSRSQWSRVGLRCLLEVLREQGVAPGCAAASEESATEVLLTSFSCYLQQERALSAGTVCGYVAHARQFRLS